MIRIKLIENWQQARKFWSVIFSTIGAAIMGVFTVWPETAYMVWQSIPDEYRVAIPQSWVSGIGLALFLLSSFSRIVKQAKLEKPEDAPQ
jgi:hypothetical protein